jgi:ribosomal protein S21
LPIVIKAKKNQSTNDLIRNFKKKVAATDIVQMVKDRRYYQKPSKIKSVAMSSKRRLKKRMHSLKKMKNTPSFVIERITRRLNSGK